MKKCITTLICFLGFITINLAQTSELKSDQVIAQRKISLEQIAAAAKEVGLNEQKIEKLTTVFEDLYKNIDTIKADHSLTPEIKKEKLNAANSTKDWKIKALLGDKFKSFNEARKKLIADANNAMK